MRLNELLQDAFPGCELGVENPVITGIAADSRAVEPGNVFVAMRGMCEDGHLFIPEAVARGAVCVVGEDACDAAVPYVRVEDARAALADLALAFYEHPERKLCIVGVTGTNGKTTTTHLIWQILRMSGKRCGLIGTNQIRIGEESRDAVRTTPDALELAKLFDEMVRAGLTHVVMEVSSHSLSLSRVRDVMFTVAALTNITQDHLDFHHSMEEYAAAKAKLFTMCHRAALNRDDQYYETIASQLTVPCTTYALDTAADLRATNLRMSERGVLFDVESKDGTHSMRLGLVGKFNVYNALAAIAVCTQLGLAWEDISKGLVLSRPVRGRAEVLSLRTPFNVMIDYAHTPDGLENILSAVREFVTGRIIVVTGCGGDRDRSKRPQMGAIATRLADLTVFTSDNPRTENPADIIDDIVAELDAARDHFTVIENRREAIAYALSVAQPKDLVLLAGKGHETYQIIGHEKHPFDEREIVRACLETEG